MRNVRLIRVFVPSKDFEISKAFYQALGWKMLWNDDDLADMELGGHRFYLQKFYNKDWAENFMLHIIVDSAQEWYDFAKAVIEKDFPEARISPPKDEGYAVVTYVWDPAGVLLHFAQPNLFDV